MDHGEASCLILFFCWTVHETPSNMISKNYYITFSRHPGVVFGIRKQAKIYIYFFSKSMVKMSAEMGWNLAKHLKSLSDTELRFSEWSWNVRCHDLTCIRLYLYKRICQVMLDVFCINWKYVLGVSTRLLSRRHWVWWSTFAWNASVLCRWFVYITLEKIKKNLMIPKFLTMKVLTLVDNWIKGSVKMQYVWWFSYQLKVRFSPEF